MPLRENGLYKFTPHTALVYVANWSEAWGAWVLKPYTDGIVAPDPAYFVTRHGLIVQPSGYPSSWQQADLVYVGQKTL
jgi:hypothetical protein